MIKVSQVHVAGADLINDLASIDVCFHKSKGAECLIEQLIFVVHPLPGVQLTADPVVFID